jgi:hypothetical protein
MLQNLGIKVPDGPLTNLKPKQLAIVQEIYRALDDLGASPELLSAVGSWGDTRDDDDTLRSPRLFNTSSIFTRVICKVNDTP